jgi:DNA-directed RNA polymerase specialized sigma24 family protein
MPALRKKHTEFTNSYSDYYSIVFGVLYSKVENQDTAQDLAQEVFIRYYEKIEEVKNAKTWLLGVVRIVLFEYYRLNKKLSVEVAQEEAEWDVSLAFVNGFRESRIIIDESISQIENSKDKILFDLISVQYYTFAEAASMTGLSYYQVTYRYGLILKKVISHLNSRGIKQLEDLL